MNDLLYNSHDQWNEQYRFRCADGTYKHIYDRAYILRDRNKQPYRMIGTMQDITEQVLLREKLEKEKETKQKAILKAVIEGQEKERNYIARELHDNVNQILVSANMRLAMAFSGTQVKSVEMIEESQYLIKSAVQEIRKLTHTMVSSQVDEIGLVQAIEDLVDGINSLRLFKILFTHNLADNTIVPPPIALTIFRIIQEQSNNIIKYAAAKNVSIALNLSGDDLLLSISDNGKGADIDQVKKGIGLSNIKNRVNAYNGKTVFQTSPGEGFRLSIEIPLK